MSLTLSPHLSEILGGLFLGGHPSRYECDGKLLGDNAFHWLYTKANVRLVVCCCAKPASPMYCLVDIDSGTVTTFLSSKELRAAASGISCRIVALLNIPAEDAVDFPIASYFPATCEEIRHWNEERGQNVLVHCQVGASRSATIVAAHLITRFAATDKTGPAAFASFSQSTRAILAVAGSSRLCAEDLVRNVIAHLEACRPHCVSPNRGFLHALIAHAEHELTSFSCEGLAFNITTACATTIEPPTASHPALTCSPPQCVSDPAPPSQAGMP
jgi:hypothetical protein